MRRRLAVLSLSVSLLVVVAFLVPLAILVRNQAAVRALTRAERDTQAIAAVLAVVGSERPVDPETADDVLVAFGRPPGLSVIFEDGTVVGAAVSGESHIDRALAGAAFSAEVSGGVEVLVPVFGVDAPAEGATVVVRDLVADAELTRGVRAAWLLLGSLGAFLVLVAVVAADRLGRSIVRPVGELSAAARRLGEGDLETRVVPSGPREIAEVGEAFNFLAGRLSAVLAAERETVADLSHRLRTPLTVLRLRLGTVENAEVAGLAEDLDRVERAVDRIIAEARSGATADSSGGRSDLVAVVRHRWRFWEVVGAEQGRPAELHAPRDELLVPLEEQELGALVDVLLDNVFAHTPAGVGYRLRVDRDDDGRPRLTLDDDGPGFPDLGVLQRGESSRGSTGLGLAIVGRSVLRVGGSFRLASSDTGGARVVIVFPEPAPIVASNPRRWSL